MILGCAKSSSVQFHTCFHFWPLFSTILSYSFLVCLNHFFAGVHLRGSILGAVKRSEEEEEGEEEEEEDSSEKEEEEVAAS